MTRTLFRRVAALALSIFIGAGMVVATSPPALAGPADASLTGLTVSAGTLTPAFDPTITSYSVEVPHTTTSFSFTPEAGPDVNLEAYNGDLWAPASTGTAVTGVARPGNNLMMVTASIAGGAGVSYSLHITKLAPPPPAYDLALSSIAVSEGTLSPAFDSAVTNYTVDVAYATSSLAFTLGSVATGNTVALAATMPIDGMTVKLAASGTAAFITVTAPDATLRQYVVQITRGPAPTADVTLAALELSVGTLSPAFDPAVRTYTATVPYAVRSMEVTATASTSGHTLTINNAPMVDGAPATVPLIFDPMGNGFGINIRAANGIEMGYTLIITRDQPSNNADLTSLALSNADLSPVFSNAETDYAVTVPYLTTSTKVTATVADSTAILRVNNKDTGSGTASHEIPLRVGSNAVAVDVMAEDSVTETKRTIIITREAPVLDLAALTVTGGTLSPSFDADTTGYTLALPYRLASVDVAAAALNSDWALTINGQHVTATSIAVPVGASTITVTVTAAHGESRDYTIAVTRTAPSTITTLGSVSLSEGSLSPAFDPAVREYSASVEYLTTEITVDASVTDATSSVTINGMAVTSAVVPLTEGENTVRIVTVAQDGVTTATTTIIVTRERALAPSAGFELGFSSGDTAEGAWTTLRAANLLPGSGATITMFSTPIVIASGTVLADGTIVLSGRIPAGTEPGAHRFVFDGVARDGAPVTRTAWFTVLADGTIGGVSLLAPVTYAEPSKAVSALPVTGTNAATPLALGTGVAALGTMLMMLGGLLRRRHASA